MPAPSSSILPDEQPEPRDNIQIQNTNTKANKQWLVLFFLGTGVKMKRTATRRLPGGEERYPFFRTVFFVTEYCCIAPV